MGFESWDEHELVRRCKEGAEAGYAELVRRHRQRLINLAYRLTGSRETAEDVVQEAFIAAFRTMERFEPKPSVSAWLNTITVRLAGRAASKQAAAPRASLDRILDPGPVAGSAAGDRTPARGGGDAGAMAGLLASADVTLDPHAAAEAAEVRREVAGAMAELPFKHRTAVVLRFVMGLDYAEAARIMDIPLNTYKSHLLRGTRQLRGTLAPRLAGASLSGAPTRTADGGPIAGGEPAARPDPAGATGSDIGTAPDRVPTFGEGIGTAAGAAAPAPAPHLYREKPAER